MVLAIEPMVNAGGARCESLADGWTVVTPDGSLSAHFEHTVAITDDGPLDSDAASRRATRGAAVTRIVWTRRQHVGYDYPLAISARREEQPLRGKA